MNHTRKTNFLARLIKYGVGLLSALALICGSAGAMLYKGSVKAEEGKILTTDLIATNAESEVATENGLVVNSTSAYQGEFKGVFQKGKNVSLKFAFDTATANPNFANENGNSFIIRVADVTDARNFFDVVWTPSEKKATTTNGERRRSAVYVKWGDEIRSAKHDNANRIYNVIDASNQRAYPYITTDSEGYENESKGLKNAHPGKLTLSWNGDALSVAVNAYTNTNEATRVRAVFDGTYDATATDNGFVCNSSAPKNNQWGLPYLDFSSGYTLSFMSAFKLSSGTVEYNSVGAVFKELTYGENTYALTTNESIVAPSFYTEYQKNTPESKQIPLDVMTNGDVSTDMTNPYYYDGVVVSAEAGTSYSGEFSARMKGDMSLKFNFPEKFASGTNTNREFVYTVCDNAGNEIFDVVYFSNGGYTTCYVKYGDQYRSYSYGYSGNSTDGYGNHYWYDIYNAEGKLLYYGDKAFFAPTIGSTNANYAYRQGTAGWLQLVWERDVLSVYANYNKGATEYMVKIASFDGSDVGFTAPEKRYATEEEFASIGWGLPKLTDLQDGYSLKFYSENKEEVPVSVNFIELQADAYTPLVVFTDNNGEAIDGLDSGEAKYNGSYTLPTTIETLAEDEKLIGWYNEKEGKLYKPGATIEGVRVNVEFAAYTLGFKMMDGASIRIVAGNTSDSGIRFQTGYDTADYAVLNEKGFVKEVGTLLSIANTTSELVYDGEGVVSETNTKEHYTVDEKGFDGYKLYSFAINEISAEDATKVISARGYIAIEYADGVDYIYTTWTAENNVRSVAEVAYSCQNAVREEEDMPTEYEMMSAARKSVIDYFAAFNTANVEE